MNLARPPRAPSPVLFISLALHRVPDAWLRYLPAVEHSRRRGGRSRLSPQGQGPACCTRPGTGRLEDGGEPVRRLDQRVEVDARRLAGERWVPRAHAATVSQPSSRSAR